MISRKAIFRLFEHLKRRLVDYLTCVRLWLHIDQEAIDNRLLSDIRAIDLNLVDCISAQIIFCAVLVKFSLNTVYAFANIVPSLCVLPIKICGEVLKLLHPHIQTDLD
jgi:hypothetical protein